jgi:hypothetical protein
MASVSLQVWRYAFASVRGKFISVNPCSTVGKGFSRFALTIRERYDFAMSAILKDEEFVAVEAAVAA